jgi:hypothetical protein
MTTKDKTVLVTGAHAPERRTGPAEAGDALVRIEKAPHPARALTRGGTQTPHGHRKDQT